MIRDIKGKKMRVCFIAIVFMLLLSTLIVLADIKTYEGTVNIIDDTTEVFFGIEAEAPITCVMPKKYANGLNAGDKVKCRFLMIKYGGLLKYYLIDVKKIS